MCAAGPVSVVGVFSFFAAPESKHLLPNNVVVSCIHHHGKFEEDLPRGRRGENAGHLPPRIPAPENYHRGHLPPPGRNRNSNLTHNLNTHLTLITPALNRNSNPNSDR